MSETVTYNGTEYTRSPRGNWIAIVGSDATTQYLNDVCAVNDLADALATAQRELVSLHAASAAAASSLEAAQRAGGGVMGTPTRYAEACERAAGEYDAQYGDLLRNGERQRAAARAADALDLRALAAALRGARVLSGKNTKVILDHVTIFGGDVVITLEPPT